MGDLDSLGWAYYQKGDYARAIEQLEKAVHLVVDDPTIVEHLGDAYLKTGELQKALKTYKKALKGSSEKEQIDRIRPKIGLLEQEI